MSNFPISQDDSSTLPNPIAGNFTTAPDHAVLHSTENDAIKALETKLGTGASTSTSNTFLIGNGTGTSTWSGLTSAQLAARISDETGSGSLVFGTSPNITTPTGIVKGDVGLGNVDNTSDTTKNAASVTLTNKTIDGGSNTLTNISGGNLTSSSVTGSKIASYGFPFQTITTNSTQSAVILQTGWSFITGDGASQSLTKTITFPSSYTTPLNVFISQLGLRSGSDPTVIADFNGSLVSTTIGVFTTSISITNFVAHITITTGVLSNGTRYGFSWMAMGS